MAAVTQLLYMAPGEASSLYLNYDDTTLLATGLTLSCGINGFPAFRTSFVIAGVTTSLQCTPGHTNKAYVFPAAILLNQVINKQGQLALLLPFDSFSAGHGLVLPGSVTVL